MQSKSLFDIGPLLPESDILEKSLEVVEETDPCILWLNEQKPSSVLYICFGSQTALTRTQIHELALGIEASGVSFLWIMKLPDAWGPQDNSKGPVSMTEYLPPGEYPFLIESCSSLSALAEKLFCFSTYPVVDSACDGFSRFRGADEGKRNDLHWMGASKANFGACGHRRLLDSLRMELDPGERDCRRADAHMARLGRPMSQQPVSHPSFAHSRSC